MTIDRIRGLYHTESNLSSAKRSNAIIARQKQKEKLEKNKSLAQACAMVKEPKM